MSMNETGVQEVSVEDGIPVSDPQAEALSEHDASRAESSSDDKTFFDSPRTASRDYRRLCQEREEQEASAALQAAAEKRRRFFERRESSQGGKPVTPSLWPYKKHYKKYLMDKLEDQCVDGRFCDVGSAPGGMTAFLCDCLGMTGYAFSLAADEGGFDMTFDSTARDPAFVFQPCDMSEPDAWKNQLLPAVGGEKFNFINLGVTLQWQKPTPKNEEKGSEEEEEEECETTVRDNRLTMQQIIRNELLFALQNVSDGGSFMTTLPNSDHPNSFLYLKYLMNCTLDPAKSIAILPTPKLSRKPVYVLVQEVNVGGEGVKNFLDFLLSTEARPENDAKWLVQSWEEAAPIFKVFKKPLECIWGQQRWQLQKERRKAEKEYHHEE